MSRPACTDPEVLAQRKLRHLAKNAAYRARNRAALAEKQKQRLARLRAEDEQALLAKLRDYRRAAHAKNPELKAKARIRARERHEKKKNCPEYRAENVLRVQNWYEKNKARAVSNANNARKRRIEVDVNYRLGIAIRRRLWMAVRGKGGSAVEHLGCSIEELRAYLAAKFAPGMSWKNYGQSGWHIDHVKPLSRFDLTDPEQLAQACHYSNLQPLWAAANISKGARYAEVGRTECAA